MRVVHSEGELDEAITSASREASVAFGDGTVFIEPFIARGRHIEVQIVGDSFGNVVHLGERECSIQRRNQKVIEEAPSAGISDAVRSSVIEGALALAHHVGYESAGTVEFMVGDDESITFLEVNTRLQVEHPVTEAVTGLDIVELQLRVAAGGVLPVSQADITITGHAIEARVVAENPEPGWVPSVGRLASFAFDDAVRVDSGVASGSVVTTDFDSMLAKVIAFAPSRSQAAAVLARSLTRSAVFGVDTNVGCLAAIMAEPDFLAAETYTSYLGEHPEVVLGLDPSSDVFPTLLIAATFAAEERHRLANRVTGFAPSGWRNLRTRGQRRIWKYGETEQLVEYVAGPRSEVLLGPWPMPQDDGTLPADERESHDVNVRIDVEQRGLRRVVVELDGVRTVTRVHLGEADGADGDRVYVSSPRGSAVFVASPIFVEHEAERGAGGPVSPLPGTVIAVHVAAGESVVEGQLLMVVEAMKMEHKIVAGTEGVIDEVLFVAGDRVDSGELLVRLESAEGK